MPIQPALNIIEKLLKEDTGLQNGTTMSIKHIMDLLEFCLRSTYFTYQGKYYEQVEGAAMGSPISLIVANLYMENFEVRALSTSPNPPLMWKRFVDDTFLVMKKAHKEEFLTHLNSVDKNIQFTTEEPRPDGSIPFLDMLITPGKDGRLDTTVYRKPTTLISTCIGTVITQFPPSIVWLGHSIIEPRPYVPTNSCYSKKKNICQKY